MNLIKVVCLLILAVLVESCHGKNERFRQEFYLKEIETGTDSTFKKVHYPNQKGSLYSTQAKYYNALVETFIYYQDDDKTAAREIKTFMEKKLYGHNFEFFENGFINSYQYNVGNGHYFYQRVYSRAGTMIKEQGTPFVDIISDDKGTSTLYFVNTFSDSLSVEMSSHGGFHNFLSLKKSSMQPMLFESNIQFKDSLYFLTIKTMSRFSGDHVYLDTINTKLLKP